jgi:membrane protein required for colicin V production
MFIDFIFVLLLAMAAWKGFSKGLIVAIFSFLAIFIGLAAALKLSAVVAGWLAGSTNIGSYWLPFLSFVLVMIGVAFLVRLGGRVLERTANALLLGPFNKLGGFLLYAIIYLLLYSVLLFYSNQLGLLKETTIAGSKTFHWIAPWGPRAINGLGRIIPLFRDLFAQLQQFFDSMHHTK